MFVVNGKVESRTGCVHYMWGIETIYVAAGHTGESQFTFTQLSGLTLNYLGIHMCIFGCVHRQLFVVNGEVEMPDYLCMHMCIFDCVRCQLQRWMGSLQDT